MDSILPLQDDAAREIRVTEEPATVDTCNSQEKKVDNHSHPLETWKRPRRNLYRFLVTIFCLMMLGANDSCTGALLPYLEKYYNINFTVVATLFLSPLFGYTFSAFLLHRMHMYMGQRGIVIVAAFCKLVSYLVTCLHPPFPVLPIIFVFAGFANGLEDGAWSAWVGSLDHPNELMGVLHGAYGIGAIFAPLISTAMATKAGLPWYTFYYIMLGGASVELIFGSIAFKADTGVKFRSSNPVQTAGKSGTREALKYKVSWIIALFLLFYLGVEVALGGWVVTFMLNVRKGDSFDSGLVVTGFWIGLTLGRVLLSFTTGPLGEKLTIAIYLCLATAFELMFWLIPSFTASAICSAFIGFVLGPIFPAGIIIIMKLLPSHLHVSAIGFVVAMGASGASIMPFVVGSIAGRIGIQVLGPIVLALIVMVLLLWCSLPGGFKKNNLDNLQNAILEDSKRQARESQGIGKDQIM